MIQQGLIKPVFALSTMLDAHFGKHIYTWSGENDTKNSSTDRPSTRSYDDCTERQKMIIHTITQSGQSSLLDITQAIAIDTTELLWELSMLEILGYIYDTGSGVYVVK
jgi:predicted transcriptional regulator